MRNTHIPTIKAMIEADTVQRDKAYKLQNYAQVIMLDAHREGLEDALRIIEPKVKEKAVNQLSFPVDN